MSRKGEKLSVQSMEEALMHPGRLAGYHFLTPLGMSLSKRPQSPKVTKHAFQRRIRNKLSSWLQRITECISRTGLMLTHVQQVAN